jgi:hypothetical protein
VNAMRFVISNYCMVMQVEENCGGLRGGVRKYVNMCMYVCMCGMNNLL